LCVAWLALAIGAFTSASGKTEPGWRLEQLPVALHDPKVRDDLGGISCASSSACMANGDGGALAVRWNGKRWSIEHAAHPPVGRLGNIYPGGVSCASLTSCSIVGSYDLDARTHPSGGVAPFAEQWSGRSWTMQPFPSPTGDDYVNADAVDCTSSRACIAVGSAWSSRTMLGAVLAERWNGSGWTIRNPPMPSASIDGDLSGVSCTSANDCTAVGYYIKARSRTAWPLADRWDGTQWHIERTPVPTGAGDGKFEDTQLSAVSCSSRSSCLAVGVSLVKGSRSLAERWDGQRWSIIPPPKKADPSLGLRSIACISRNDCLAVGGSPAVGEWWNGKRWRVQHPPEPVPNPGGPIVLDGVSCPSSSTCYAVGTWHDTNGDGSAFVERWTGHTRAAH
jgi:hypothetical protein